MSYYNFSINSSLKKRTLPHKMPFLKLYIKILLTASGLAILHQSHAPFHCNRYNHYRCRNNKPVNHRLNAGFLHVLEAGVQSDCRKCSHHQELTQGLCTTGHGFRDHAKAIDQRQRKESQNEPRE